MPRVSIAMVQGAGKPAFALTAAVSKANPAAYTAVLMASGGTAPTYFNVMDYGAHADGVTDDSPHIQAAYDAARTNSAASGTRSVVLFPPGATYAVASPVLLNTIRTNDWYGQGSPTVQQAGYVTFSGYGATIKLTSVKYGFLRAAYGGVWTVPQWATYGNLGLEGFTVDNNYRETSTMVGCILTIAGLGNCDNVTVSDVTMPNHMAYRTAAAQSAGISGILINLNPSSRAQAHTSYVTNVTVQDCSIYGQTKPIGIYSNSDGQSTFGWNPCVYDNINVYRCYTNSNHFYGSNIHIGSYASGYRCSVIDCTCEDSTDDGLEINAFNEITVQGCSFSKCRQPLCLVWYSYPYKTDTPNVTLRDNTYSGECSSYWLSEATEPADRSPMMPELRAAALVGEGALTDLWSRSWGNLTIDNCNMTFGVDNAYSTHRSPFTIGSNGPPLESVTITNCDITDVGTGGDAIYIRQGSSLGRTLPITINDVRWRNTAGGAFALLTSDQVTLVGSRTVTSDISGLT